jgi:hypothetical protein
VATRSQVIRAELVKLNKKKTGTVTTSWYLQEDIWDLVLNSVSFVADILRVTNKPAIAVAVDAVVRAAKAPAASRDVRFLKQKLEELTEKVRYITDTSSPEYVKLDAQLDLLMSLIKEKESNG